VHSCSPTSTATDYRLPRQLPLLLEPAQVDTDGDGRGDVCECTDQNGDGKNTVSDLVAINTAIFNPSLATPLCDGNNDGLCNVNDIIEANVEIFSRGKHLDLCQAAGTGTLGMLLASRHAWEKCRFLSPAQRVSTIFFACPCPCALWFGPDERGCVALGNITYFQLLLGASASIEQEWSSGGPHVRPRNSNSKEDDHAAEGRD